MSESETRIEYDEFTDPHVYGAVLTAVAGAFLMAWVAVETTTSTPVQYGLVTLGVIPGMGYGVLRINRQQKRDTERFR